MKPWHIGLAIVVLAGGGLLWLLRAVAAQRPPGSDQDQIRALIATGARAAMRRDSDAIGRLVSPEYHDASGMRADPLRRQIRSFLADVREISVNIPQNSLVVAVDADRRHATAQFYLQFRTSGARGEMNFGNTLRLQLAKEPVRYYLVFPGAEWRVVSADGYMPELFQ
jgi:hypothetical protein